MGPGIKSSDIDQHMSGTDITSSTVTVRARFTYTANAPGELSFMKGDRVKILNIGAEGLPWMKVNFNGVTGVVPTDFFVIPKGAILPKSQEIQVTRKYDDDLYSKNQKTTQTGTDTKMEDLKKMIEKLSCAEWEQLVSHRNTCTNHPVPTPPIIASAPVPRKPGQTSVLEPIIPQIPEPPVRTQTKMPTPRIHEAPGPQLVAPPKQRPPGPRDPVHAPALPRNPNPSNASSDELALIQQEEEALKDKMWYTTRYVTSSSTKHHFERILLARDPQSDSYLYPDGAFLVSKTNDDSFAISIKRGEGIEMYKLIHTVAKGVIQFFVWVVKFPSIIELVKYYTINELNRQGEYKIVLKETFIKVE